MNNDLIKKIKEDYYNLSDTNKIIADNILKTEGTFNLSIQELSKASYCSNSSIINFCNTLGYDSYKVFKHDLNKTNTKEYTSIIESFDLVETFIKNNNKLINTFIKKINSSNNIYIFATGQSRISAIDFYLRVNKKLDDKVIFEYEPSAQERTIKTINNNDLVIFISNSGKSRELLSFITKIDVKDDNIFLITNRDKSLLSKKIKNIINLNNQIESETNFKEFPRESKYSLLYFFDIIFSRINK